MIDDVTVAVIFTTLLQFFDRVKQGKIKRDQRTDKALGIIHTALLETINYLRVISVQERVPKKEIDIARLWYKAGVAVRYIDQKLAEICSLKGGYWSNPDVWDELRSSKHNISIENVEKQAFELLSHSK